MKQQLRPLVNNHIVWTAFVSLREDSIISSTKSLEKATDHVQIYRAQGQIEAYRKLLRLRDEVNG